MEKEERKKEINVLISETEKIKKEKKIPRFLLTILMNEVLPAPLGPSIPKHSPRGKARDNPRTAYLSGFPSFPG